MSHEYSPSSQDTYAALQQELLARTVETVPDTYELMTYPQPTDKPFAPHSYGMSWVERAIDLEPDVLFAHQAALPQWVEAYAPLPVVEERPRKKLGQFVAKFLSNRK